MSNTDSFIEEVTDEVRRDRMFALWKRYGPLLIGAIVLIVAGAAFMNWWDHRQVQAARADGGQILQALEIEDPAERAAALLDLEGSGEGANVLADMAAAGALVEAGETEQAAEIYDQIAGVATLTRPYSDLARFKAITLRSSGMEPKAVVEALAPLAEPEAPYRLLALEAQATAHVKDGDVEAARGVIAEIIADPNKTEYLEARVTQLLAAIGDGE